MGDMAKSHGKEVSITEALTKELMEELNCNTVFTIPRFWRHQSSGISRRNMDHYGVIDSPLHFTDKKLIH